MNKYTIEVYLKDMTGYESTTTLFDLSYLELLETYAIINAFKFNEAKIVLKTTDISARSISFEEFIISISAEKMISEINQHWIICPNKYLKNSRRCLNSSFFVN